MITQKRAYEIRQVVTTQGRDDQIVHHRIFGYEYSDGVNSCGRPRTLFKGWFYSVHNLQTGEELILPETALTLFQEEVSDVY